MSSPALNAPLDPYAIGAAPAASAGPRATPAPASADAPVFGALTIDAFGPLGVNWIGLWTLYVKEVRRFWAVATQSVAAPVVTTLLFLAVFVLALGRENDVVEGVRFASFLAPGLIMMAMTQNAFANTSSSLVISKVQGNIVDLLMPPLSPGEVLIGLVLAGVTRGLTVGVAVTAAMTLATHLGVADASLILFHAVAASTMMALLGVIGGLWAEKFDHLSAVTNFVVTPLAFLSGTFYSVLHLPAPFDWIALFNPFFYMIDGFRAGFIGHADGSLRVGIAVLIAANLALIALAYRLLRRGYKLKA
jgi:ABC-2 type transport system permease protein